MNDDDIVASAARLMAGAMNESRERTWARLGALGDHQVLARKGIEAWVRRDAAAQDYRRRFRLSVKWDGV